MVDGHGTETGHIIVTTIGGRNGQPKHVFLYHFVRIAFTVSPRLYVCILKLLNLIKLIFGMKNNKVVTDQF